ncbi:hypothetical protein BpHYR1_007125 [Brachionus plicatilis]|uniref:Uncharacterized protein n=1 Tax=Brachionus plicatilis TaxID=10195 RepID=A0A3M7QEH7_BRAPC|nr:hypothetical protein BpHYR1_007125 [Brachionus plicatilis]
MNKKINFFLFNSATPRGFYNTWQISIPLDDIDNISIPLDDIDNISIPLDDIDNISIPLDDIDNISIPLENIDKILILLDDIDFENIDIFYRYSSLSIEFHGLKNKIQTTEQPGIKPTRYVHPTLALLYILLTINLKTKAFRVSSKYEEEQKLMASGISLIRALQMMIGLNKWNKKLKLVYVRMMQFAFFNCYH